MRISDYRTLVFDCDGVILNSNKLKTRAFYQAALPYGESPANSLVQYHVANGGVSRYRKFRYFLENLVPSGAVGPSLEELLSVYAVEVRNGLLSCEVAEGLKQLRMQVPATRWLVVSGGDQEELREVFSSRGMIDWFDGGIFGSPDSKDQILSREIANQNINNPALFLGDSRYDHVAATRAGLDFVFCSEWSEFGGWAEYCQQSNIQSIANVNFLVNKNT